ncbi:unnamed protein product [Symbiodinium sp. KB8]|nr:unnamed protein product [Symbiodinium sp. KB8]
MGRGLRQGCSLAPILWSIYSGWALTKIHQPGLVDIPKCNTSYADDLFFGWTISSGQEMAVTYRAIRHILESLGKQGLQLSLDKTVIVLGLKGPGAAACIKRYVVERAGMPGQFMKFQIGGEAAYVKIVKQHLYLGAQISFQKYEQATAKYRMGLAKGAYTRLAPVLKCRTVPLKLRLHLWHGTILPTLLHGLDCMGLLPTEAAQMMTIFYQQARAIAKSFSMYTHETNMQFARRLKLASPILRLLKAIDNRAMTDSALSPGLRAGDVQLQWRHFVRGQLSEAKDALGTSAGPKPPQSCSLLKVQDIIPEDQAAIVKQSEADQTNGEHRQKYHKGGPKGVQGKGAYPQTPWKVPENYPWREGELMDVDQAQLKAAVQMLTTIVIRQENQRAIARQGTSYVLFVRHDGKVRNDGGNGLKWDPEARKHVKDDHIQPLGIQEIREEYTSQNLTMMLEIGLRTEKANLVWRRLGNKGNHCYGNSALRGFIAAAVAHGGLSAMFNGGMLGFIESLLRSKGIVFLWAQPFWVALMRDWVLPSRQHDGAEFILFLLNKLPFTADYATATWQDDAHARVQKYRFVLVPDLYITAVLARSFPLDVSRSATATSQTKFRVFPVFVDFEVRPSPDKKFLFFSFKADAPNASRPAAEDPVDTPVPAPNPVLSPSSDETTEAAVEEPSAPVSPSPADTAPAVSAAVPAEGDSGTVSGSPPPEAWGAIMSFWTAAMEARQSALASLPTSGLVGQPVSVSGDPIRNPPPGRLVLRAARAVKEPPPKPTAPSPAQEAAQVKDEAPDADAAPAPPPDTSNAPPVAVPKVCPIPLPGGGSAAASSGAGPVPGRPGSSNDPAPDPRGTPDYPPQGSPAGCSESSPSTPGSTCARICLRSSVPPPGAPVKAGASTFRSPPLPAPFTGRFRGTGLSPSVLLLLNAACLPAAESGTAANPDRSAVETKNALPHRRLFVSGTALCVLCSCLACRTWWRFWSPRSWAGLLARLRPSLPLPQLVPLILPHSVYSCFGVGSWYIL